MAIIVCGLRIPTPLRNNIIAYNEVNFKPLLFFKEQKGL